MAAKYSRLQRVQATKERRRGLLFAVLSLVLLVIFVVYILPLVPRITSQLNDFAGREVETKSLTGNVLRAPRFSELPEYTSEEKVVAKGVATAGETVIISFNNTTKELITNSDGEFSSTFYLKEGENTLSAGVQGPDGEIAASSDTYTIVLDNEPPDLEIIKPSDGESFFGISNRQVEIEGQTEEDARVTINDQVAIVDRNGKFSKLYNLEEGENKYKIVAVDEAGNAAELELTINYSI